MVKSPQSAATNKRDLSAQGRRRSSPLAPLLELPAPPRAKARPSPVRRKEHGFTVGRRQSGRVGEISDDPESEPDYDEQDIELDAWMSSVVVESKATDTPAETIQVIEASANEPVSSVDTMDLPQGDQHVTMTSSEIESSANGPVSSVDTMGLPQGGQHITMTSSEIEPSANGPGSSVDTMGEPQGDQHITVSSSLVVESSDHVPVSTTMSTSTAMVVEETPTAVQRTNRYNFPPIPANYSSKDFSQRVQQANQMWLDEAREEIDSLRSELSRTQLLNTQLQSLLEEDQESHPSNKRVTALQAQLTTDSTTLLCDQGE